LADTVTPLASVSAIRARPTSVTVTDAPGAIVP
jgi:hypothetical protein